MYNKHEIQWDQAASWSLWTPSPKVSILKMPIFLLKKCEKLLHCKSFAYFINKNIIVFGYKALNT